MEIDNQYKQLLLEALEDLMYKISLKHEDLKGGLMTNERKELTKKQKRVESLQHLIECSN